MHNKYQDTKKIFVELSQKFGFDAVGFVKAEFLSKYETSLVEWLQNEYNASMHYMAKEPLNRLNPNFLLADAKTIFVFLYNYKTNFRQSQDKYKVSKYAFLEDYHLFLRQKIQSIVDEATQTIGVFKYKIAIDSAPILEKALAVEAGLGWWGKNSLLLTKKGSFFFISILLTDLELEIHSPIVKNYCGSCTRCIDACPTKAIVKPYVVDSRKCISYLTIEKKGELTEDEKLHNWLFGCDVCQDICPWNSKSVANQDASKYIIPEVLNFDEKQWHNIAENDFKMLFNKSPLKRSKYYGIKRNIDVIDMFQ